MHSNRESDRAKWLCLLLSMLLAACAPKVGSDEWCAAMKAKSPGDWTPNEGADFAKHCIFK